MPQWKVATPKPGGSLPEGLLNKIMVGHRPPSLSSR